MVGRLILLTLLFCPAALADGYVFAPPPGASSNLTVFRQQMIDYNFTQLFNALKQNDGSVRHAEEDFIELGHSMERGINGQSDPNRPVDPLSIQAAPVIQSYSYVPPDNSVKSRNAIDVKNIVAFNELRYTDVCLKNSFDAKFLNYKSEIMYGGVNLFYLRSIKSSDNNVGLRYNLRWK